MILNGVVIPTNADGPAAMRAAGMRALSDPPSTMYNVTINGTPLVLNQQQFFSLFLGF
jgi:hypothetical protein